ncbi:MAG: DUF177 domain-containing protein [Thermoanaerobaculia bacterium]|nr:DUF177 domain-containing protein [Thermoanaerobaculia bacterium]
MRVDLDKVREQPFRWDETAEISTSDLDHKDLVELGPVHWEGRIDHVDPGFLLRADFEYEQVLRCRRCLGPVEQEVEGEIELLLTREPEELAEDDVEIELEEEDLGVFHYREEEIELEPFLEEELHLNIPMNPLCRPDCEGLCSQCGANLNEETCSCEEEPVDSRWEGLAAIKERLEE